MPEPTAICSFANKDSCEDNGCKWDKKKDTSQQSHQKQASREVKKRKR
jgi:hypothetical protein